jgi:LAGLIDADG-like domain
MHPRGKVDLTWSADFAYAIGLLATDGCVYSNGKVVNLTSKDREQVENLKRCLRVDNAIGKKSSGRSGGGEYFQIQIGDVRFVDFLHEIGIAPNKTKTIGAVDVPQRYFFDFLRGHLDGDGSFYSYWDTRWHSSFMVYTTFVSASERHILWVREAICSLIGIAGHVTTSGKTPMVSLRYAKRESLKLLSYMYYNRQVVCLSRKRDKIEKALAVEGRRLFL